jgi:hypothetical protein
MGPEPGLLGQSGVPVGIDRDSPDAFLRALSQWFAFLFCKRFLFCGCERHFVV